MPRGIVSTIGQRCKRCYSCIRECPARAIRVMNGQAVVIDERCISCGHCVKVCSQNAKRIQSDIDLVVNEILPLGNSIIMLAPSFPASFPDDYKKIPSALKKIGFKYVTETAFGADLVSQHYSKIYDKSNGNVIISSPCPAVYNLVEMYHTSVVKNLAGVVSPMIAMGRYLKSIYGKEIKIVFAGPCVAKKSEYKEPEVNDAVDAVLTFKELKELFVELKIDLKDLPNSAFDPPFAFLGKSYPLTGGLLKTANIPNGVLEKETVIVEGKNRVIEIIEEISEGKLKSKFVDILFCEGCINGPAIDSDLNFYSRREKILNYIDENINQCDKTVWKSDLYNSRELNLKRKFHNRNQRKPMPSEEEIKYILARTNKFNKGDELNCGSCGYPSCREYAIAIAKDLAEDDMCLPYLIDKLELAYKELKETQDQLQSAEKLASIGQLAAGVAHEINNPLGSVLLYASMIKRKIDKNDCIGQNKEDLQLIIDEANRCKNIVSNLLNFARQGKLKIGLVKIGDVIRSLTNMIKINPDYLEVDFSIIDNSQNGFIEGDVDQLKQVFINIITNAIEAVEASEHKNISITINKNLNHIQIEIADSGCGIPQENMNKIFTPFFTTKKIGKGTGLGLAISYGIIKMHKGDVSVKSNLNSGTTFTISLPIKNNLFNNNYKQNVNDRMELTKNE